MASNNDVFFLVVLWQRVSCRRHLHTHTVNVLATIARGRCLTACSTLFGTRLELGVLAKDIPRPLIHQLSEDLLVLCGLVPDN